VAGGSGRVLITTPSQLVVDPADLAAIVGRG
jgi:hypothetical protein